MDGAQVEFAHDRVEVEGEPGLVSDSTRFPPLASLGPLQGKQLDRLISALGVVPGAVAVAKAASKAESGKPEDYREFLHELYVQNKLVACERLAGAGHYVTFESGATLPALPSRFDIFAQLNLPGPEGKRVDVYFLIDLGDPANSAVRSSREQLADFDSSQEVLDIAEFNAKPLEERVRIVEASEDAARRLRTWPTDGSGSVAEAAQLRSALLPHSIRVSRPDYVATRRGY